MGVVESVNIGRVRPIEAETGVSGIDKRPVPGPVRVQAPEPGGSGLAGDRICDVRHHGGPDQAVHAYAREDLDGWEGELGPLPSGVFGENLTTRGVDVTGAVIGERWRVGGALVLQVTTPRIPCRTFAAWLARQGWVRTFTDAARPGAYLRVVEPGEVRAGDAVAIAHRPVHGVTVGTAFRALLTAPDLLPVLAGVHDLPQATRDQVARRLGA
ncbi:MOSC domain-containing protein [Pseudonocardia abyssalis]|jgi:MOSC domain-containing protein YiiM|uniref:MOSC domain-containing protein n=1 Tax=Pseudonocardia abyssalis TaxID=2792008 RepID=A0ABS6URX4_9PSEU|nr:MOSC domain-containing protein [Pseudonocardia abyssalis]MBW0115047.1 MOSC domain-containing protein [Pseudonocardia abyssalis]MBW0134696.1 MOSC domain-containing protein [Pseudonocardia abyssalis]